MQAALPWAIFHFGEKYHLVPHKKQSLPCLVDTKYTNNANITWLWILQSVFY
jgi:hypothetical protein